MHLLKCVKVAVLVACGVALGGALPAATVVKLDPTKTLTPISPYIYGQFIEHLGKCIYGGLWAEMLQDRKFYYPISDNYNPWGVGSDPQWNTGPYIYLNASPWRVVGPAGTVTMDTGHPFTGNFSPLVHLAGDGSAGGISQDGLALVKGKAYTGRIILLGDDTAAPVVVQLVLDDGQVLTQTIDKLTRDYQTYPLAFTAPIDSANARLAILSKGQGTFEVGPVSLMPADNLKGWRPDTVALLQQLDAPIYRWPGGNFVSGYNWRDGIGPRDQRPPRHNPAWKGVEANDVGIKEYMELMGMINAEPYISVNTGLGTMEEVAQEVQYCNGAADTPMGKLRADNGHPEPYHVTWWAVGNEMFGNWQLGHMPLEQYVQKHNQIADAMWKMDPAIKLVAVGEVGPWDEMMLKICANDMTLLSEHIYVKEKKDVPEHVSQLADEIKRVADAHRQYQKDIPELAGKNIRVAMDEWNYWYGNYLYGELGVQYHLKDALGIAKGLHEYFRNSDIFEMANYAQTVNVIGAIKTNQTSAVFDTTALPLILYRHQFGTLPIAIENQPDGLDVSAAWTADKEVITVAIVNPLPIAQQITLDLGNFELHSAAKEWVIEDTKGDPMATNVPGQVQGVTLEEKDATITDNTLDAPPLSVVLYRLQPR
jgi:alpha-N-arabinofuranosidase